MSDQAKVDQKSGQVMKYTLLLEDIRNTQYVGTLAIGNPPQKMDVRFNPFLASVLSLLVWLNLEWFSTFNLVMCSGHQVILDTGSSNLWVNSEKCMSEGCRAHHRFDQSKSSTFKSLDMAMSVKFGSGRIYGVLGKDTVAIGPIRVKQQTFGLIEREEGSIFMSGNFDGILGLSFPALSAAKGHNPLMDSIMKQRRLASNTFSFYYSDRVNEHSVVTFGEPDSSRYVGKLIWVPVTRQLYWEVAMRKMLVRGDAVGVCPPEQPCRAVLDTGTSFMTGPSRDIKRLLSKLPRLHADCSNMNEFPNIAFDLGDFTFELEPSFYIRRSRSGRFCHIAFVALDVPAPRGPLWIFGDVFMRKFYTVYDRDQARLGFAVSVNAAGRNVRPPYASE